MNSARLLLASVLLPWGYVGQAAQRREAVHLLSREILPNVPGKELVAVEVDFPPGAASVPHRHPRSAFVYAYVVSGVIESAVENENPQTYQAGESWREAPGAFHRLTRNASSTAPARLLAIFVENIGESPLVRPVSPTTPAPRK
jgi:quercetin dioxygenase-like cupin family protein